MDAKDAAVLYLVVPGVLTPFLAVANATLFGLLLGNICRPKWKLVAYTSLAESCLPLAALFVQFMFLRALGALAPDVFDQRWFRITSFLMLLYVGGVAVNCSWLVFQNWVSPGCKITQYTGLLRSLILGIVPPFIFVCTW